VDKIKLKLPQTLRNQNVAVYHNPCADGTAAAWVAQRFFNHKGMTVHLYPTDYDAAPIDAENCTIYLLDFSYKPEVMDALAAKENRVIVIDHHHDAIQALRDHGINWSKGATHPYDSNSLLTQQPDISLLDESRSGAVLAWDYFFPDKSMPLILEYVQDRDLFTNGLEFTSEISWAIKACGGDPALFDQLVGLTSYELLARGRGVYETMMFLADQCVETAHILRLQIGRELINFVAVSAPGILSTDVCRKAMEKHGTPNALSYFVLPSGDIKVSIRSNDKSAVNIAKALDGNGHPNAAGFYISPAELAVALTRGARYAKN
jgi:hypothetical protein